MTLILPDRYPGLPKWPAAFVTGTSVTPEQAKDIIFRTDYSINTPGSYSLGGNDRNFKRICEQLFGWQELLAAEDTWHSLTADQRSAFVEKHGEGPWELSHRWSEEMGMISTEYVNNSWLSSAYIGGPHGWISPKGEIFSDGHYGKWPSVSEIVADWQKLLDAFPYIEVVCTLYSGEQCEDHSVPVCTIKIGKGVVEVHEPDLKLHSKLPSMGRDDSFNHLIYSLSRGNYSHEQGWPHEWISEFAEKSRTAMKKIAPAL